LGQLLTGGHDTPFAQTVFVQVTENVPGSFQPNNVVPVEIHCPGFEHRPILNRLAHFDRKGGLIYLTTLWTAFDLGPMFSHFHPYHRQVKDLPRFVSLNLDLCQTNLALTTLIKLSNKANTASSPCWCAARTSSRLGIRGSVIALFWLVCTIL
jgi:hypothetical protein